MPPLSTSVLTTALATRKKFLQVELMAGNIIPFWGKPCLNVDDLWGVGVKCHSVICSQICTGETQLCCKS